MPPYSRCKKKQLKCIVSNDLKWYNEYVCINARYNVGGPSTIKWEKLKREERRLQEEEEEAMAKILQLRK